MRTKAFWSIALANLFHPLSSDHPSHKKTHGALYKLRKRRKARNRIASESRRRNRNK